MEKWQKVDSMKKRDNPDYPSWYCFTVAECPECGELYEPGLEHICRKRNSYPMAEETTKRSTTVTLDEMMEEHYGSKGMG